MQRKLVETAPDDITSVSHAIDFFVRQQDGAQEKVREKARTLAKQYESKGEGAVAAEYYAIAGDSGKATAVQKQTEAREQKTEESRQKNFKKEQGDLEKALGFGVVEVRVHSLKEHRVFYVAKFSEGIYVLHAFQKTTRKTAKSYIDIGSARYREVVRHRRGAGGGSYE